MRDFKFNDTNMHSKLSATLNAVFTGIRPCLRGSAGGIVFQITLIREKFTSTDV